MKEILREALYPRGIKCIVCDAELRESSRFELCDKCKLPHNDNFCTVCGRGILSQNAVCDTCKQNTYAFAAARSSCRYTDAAATLVHRLKFREAKYLAPVLAEHMADTFFKTDWQPNVVTFVPMHKSRQRMRGYNQSALLAREVAERVRLPFAQALVKAKKTKSLVGVSGKLRAQIVKDSFAVNKDVPLDGKTVLLVDDVLTTGATASECARMLRKAGAEKVYVLTFASVSQKIPLV